MESRAPAGHVGSGLFPSGPPRPTYREPHPVRFGAVMAGGGSAAVWMLLIGLMSDTTRGYFWLTVVGSLAAWLGALVLARFGDRGAAVGVAVVTGMGLSVAVAVTVPGWLTAGWPF